jgi:hypothetical protein
MRKTITWAALAAAVLAPFAGAQDNSAPRLKLVFVERFRFEAWDNAVSLDDAANDANAYTRNRTTLGLSWKPLENLEVLGKLTNEFRVYLAPKTTPFSWNESFFDNLYVKWTIPGRVPFTITAGRQDINLGEGFVIADGTPGDGSRSYYFNALRVDACLAKGHTLTAFAHATEETDRYLPVINAVPRMLAEQSERALALYYSGMFGKTRVDAYAVRKTGDVSDVLSPVRIDTFGARIVASLAKPLAFTAEAAYQTGTTDDYGRSAYGAIAHFDCDLTGTPGFLKSFVLGGILLSGDDPFTSRVEGWDPIFSRWPKWSESYIYTLAQETRSAYWSNLSAFYAQLAIDLGERVDGHVMLMPMGAGEAQRVISPGAGPTRGRGTLYRARLNYKLSRYLTGRVIWERFVPGSFYVPGASSFNWLQFEMIFRY